MLKRLVDISGSIMALAIFSPIIIMIMMAVKFGMGGPVFYRQARPGKDGQPFEIVKFRTMSDNVDGNGAPLPDSERITGMGQFLRSSSLDELPELWNVLKGEMSLVGPRPLLMEYLPLYSPEQAGRHKVRPGLTGWAQVNGRNAISWDDKFALDLWYIENQNLALDLKIIWMTIRKVLKRDGISAAGEATMPKYKGHRVKQ